MNTTNQPNFGATLRNASRLALQWRLLLLWLATLLIPTAVLSLPVWRLLAGQLDYSVHAAELAQRLDMNSLYDLMGELFHFNEFAVHEAGIAAIVLTLLLSPFLSGLLVTAARAQAPLALGKLIHGGLAEYGRMLRMLIWAIVPLGIAGAIGGGVMHLANNYAEKAILESDADLAGHAALALTLLLVALALATVDAGRAQLAADSRRRSAVLAWWRACKLACKHPIAIFGVYLVITLIGWAVIAVLGLLRINMPHATGAAFVAALLLTQVMAAMSGWMRGARLFALIDLVKSYR